MHASTAAERATWNGVMRLVDPKITAASAASLLLSRRSTAWLAAARANPLRLSYRGLGELTVALAYGPLIAGGAYLVQRGTAPGLVPLVLSLALGALLVANEFPDARADAWAGKRTLVGGLAGAPFGFAAWRRLVNEGSNTRRVVMAQRWALASCLLMAAGSALGLVEG